MTFRIRARLAILIFCFAPSLAHAQQFYHQPSTAPVALEARVSLTGSGWDPATIVAALAPGSDRAVVTRTLLNSPSPSCGLEAEATCFDANAARTARNPAGTSRCALEQQQCGSASRFSEGATADDSIEGLVGVEYCVPDALRARMQIAKRLAELAVEEPVDVAEGENANSGTGSGLSESFTLVMPAFETDEAAVSGLAVLSTTSSDAPTIVTLVQQEEYLPYDLTAIDRLKIRIFPFGIPRYQARVKIPMQPIETLEPALIESQVETTVAAAEEKAVERFIPIDCLLDELVWRVSTKLRPGSPFRQKLYPQSIGRKLARLTGMAHERSDRLIGAVAAFMPTATTNSIVLDLPQPLQLAGQPSVCCPFNPETRLADEPAPSVGRQAELVDRSPSVAEESLPPADVLAPEDLFAEATSGESASDTTADEWSDVVDEIVAAYAVSLGREVDVTLVGPVWEPSATENAADQWNETVDEIVAAYAGSWEDDAEFTLAGPASEEQSLEVALDGPNRRVDEVVALAIAGLEGEVEVALNRAVQEWQKVLEVVQSLSDEWSARVAAQPEPNSVR